MESKILALLLCLAVPAFAAHPTYEYITLTSPTSGNVITLDATQALTNKSYNGLTVTSGTNTYTLTRGTASITVPAATSGTIGSAAFTSASAYQTTLTNSAGLRAALSDESGTGAALFAGGNIGAATATSVNGLTLTSSTGTITLTNGKTLTVSNTLTLAGTDSATLSIGAGGTLGSAAFTASTAYEVPLTFSTGLTRSTNTITVNTSQNIATLSNLTSNGLVTTSGGTGALSITVPGTGVVVFLGTPSSANLATAITDETGSGALVFATSPTLVTPTIGAATGTTLALNNGGSSSAPGLKFTGATLNAGIYTDSSANTTSMTLYADGEFNGAKILIGTNGIYLYNRIFAATGINGSVSSPVFAFQDAATTGAYRPAANELGLGANGVEGVRIGTTGATAITGSATNDSAASGKVGETVSSAIASGSAVSLTTATAANITSISLTAGDWLVSGNVNFVAATATVTGTSGGVGTTSATLPTDGTEVYSGVQVTLISETDSVTLPRKRVSVSSTTTVYLIGKSTFSAGTVAAFGSIIATRQR